MRLAQKLVRLFALAGGALVLFSQPAYADTEEVVGKGLGVLAIVILVMLIAREIVCWYYKINEISSILQEIRDELKGSRGASTTESEPSGTPATDGPAEDPWS